MDFSWTQVSMALVLLAIAGIGVWAYIDYLHAGSELRLQGMLRRMGLDPQIASQQDLEATFRAIRSRCHNCQAEDLCERWLDGKISGANRFCPNRKVFRQLAERARAA